jgi:hypothetical protein
LILTEDDYSRKVVGGRIVEVESSWEHLSVSREVIERYGRPLAYYVDNHSIFRNRIGILFLFVIYFFWNKEGILPKHAGAYKGEKRRKESSRQKKQEERRQRRFHKGDRTSSDAEKVEQEETKPTNP